MSAKKIGDKVKEVLDNARTSSLPGVPAWIPTGCTILDIAIANRFPGGIPVGRIFHIFGGTGTCKTMLAALCQKDRHGMLLWRCGAYIGGRFRKGCMQSRL